MRMRGGERRVTAITPRNLAALVRYALLCLRYPQLRGRIVFVDRGADIRVERRARVRLGRDVRIMRDFTAHIAGEVSIGDGVFFNRGCHVVVLQRLAIGAQCLFGEGVSIHDENHRGGRDQEPPARRGFTTAPITIGRNVWVGAKATILQGVSIGDNAVIGANAVVTCDVPPNTLAVGVPARVVRTL
jgi:acetyltransferase-like isoleucine patch superfamily enzyme